MSVRMSVLLVPLLVWGLGVTGCNQSQDLHQRLYIFGTLLDLEIIDGDAARAQQAVAGLDHLFERMHHDWHGWKPDGELYQINQKIAAGAKQIPISAFVAPLITRSQQLYTLSDGLFNPAMGKLIGLWGFHQDDRPNGPPPARAAIKALLDRHASMNDVSIRDGVLYSRNPAVEFDFGGFAKGYALDLARRHLRQLGIRNAILNAGGDLCAMGSKGDRPWHVGIRNPQGEGAIAGVEVADGECVMTSGNYERYLEYQGVHYAHILDPRSGMPVQGIVSTTVIADDGGLADAAATALTVAGSQQWLTITRKLGLKYVLLVDDDGTIYMTRAMAERIQWQGPRPSHIVIADVDTSSP